MDILLVSLAYVIGIVTGVIVSVWTSRVPTLPEELPTLPPPKRKEDRTMWD